MFRTIRTVKPEIFIFHQSVYSLMQKPGCYENFPARIVVLSNLVSLLIYGIGAYILSMVNLIWAIIYLLFIVLIEFRLLGRHCVDCYYYGKTCAFGKGYLSSRIFSRGRPEQFNQKKMKMTDILPDFLMFIVPVLAGLVLLVQEFSWTLFSLVIALVLLGFLGNAIVRGRLACRHCKQREIGCPAEQMFNKERKN
jgi:hypothetical protein